MLKTVLAACALLCVSLAAHAETSANFLEGVRSIEVTMTRDTDGLHAMVDAAALAAGVPTPIAHAVIRQESNYNPRLRGRAGEWGIGQIKCQTARSVGLKGSCGLLADAATNLRYSMAYLKLALSRGGHGCAGVSLYQRGVFGRAFCSGYGRQVMSRIARATAGRLAPATTRIAP